MPSNADHAPRDVSGWWGRFRDKGPVRFYDEHVVADAVHEQVVRREVIGGLLEDEPALDSDIAFGIRSTGFLEDQMSEHLLASWRDGRTALREPIGAPMS